MLSTQEELTNNKKETKRKLVLDVKEVEMMCKIGETNFTAPPRPSKNLKHSTNLGLEANPTTLSSYSSTIEKKNNHNLVSIKKPSPEEKN